MVIRVSRNLYPGNTVINTWIILIRFPAHETVEFIHATMRRPTVKRAGWANFPRGRLVVLAKVRGTVTVQAEHFGKGGDVLWPNPSLSRKCSGCFGDRTHVARVMVPPGKQRHTSRRADRRCVKTVKFQTILGEPFAGWHMDRTTEGARLTKPHVVNQDNHNIRSPLRCLDFKTPRRCRLSRINLGDRCEYRIGNGKNLPIDLLRECKRRTDHDKEKRA